MAFTAERKRPVPHKKRSGGHHRKNQHYMKHYWPYLPMLLVVAAGVLLNAYWPQRAAVLGAQDQLSSVQLLRDTNKERQTADLPALKLDNRLTAAAQAKANDMVARNYWSHDTPSGQTPWSFINATGYSYASAGENLAYGLNSSSQVLSGWMHSPEHRANVLGSSYSDVGFASVSSANYRGNGPETVVVAMYASPGDVTAAPPAIQSDGSGVVTGRSLQARPVSRLSVMSPGQSLLPMVVGCLTVVCLLVFITRHTRFLHRSLVRGETFVIAHPLLDIVLLAVATLGFVLSQSGASIL